MYIHVADADGDVSGLAFSEDCESEVCMKGLYLGAGTLPQGWRSFRPEQTHLKQNACHDLLAPAAVAGCPSKLANWFVGTLGNRKAPTRLIFVASCPLTCDTPEGFLRKIVFQPPPPLSHVVSDGRVLLRHLEWVCSYAIDGRKLKDDTT